MNTAPFPALSPRELWRLLAERRTTWLMPAIICGGLAAVYSLIMPRYWEASQALVVRQETAGSRGSAPGKFADLYEMRTLQETILELAKSQQVVANTLQAVDQKLIGVASKPSAEQIEKFRKRLKMLPPNGGEFGKTEVFYFYVQDASRERAMLLVSELCRQVDAGLQGLRAARAKSLVAELQQEVAAATETLGQDINRLAEFEGQVGGDLGELRMLHSASSGQSDLRQEAVALEADHRKFETQLRETEQLLQLLRAAGQDPQQLVATPNSLLASQPALRRLKDGLVDAQLASARLGGTRSAEHPRVRAANEAEKQIRQDLHRELVTAIRGAEVELRLSQQRLASTEARQTNLDGRLSRLAEQRAEYSNRIAAVDVSRQSLDRARQNLNTALASEAASHSSSLVTRLDQPETGPYPVGPGRTVITAAGGVGGLMLGLGLVFLTTSVPSDRTQTPLRPAETPAAGEVRRGPIDLPPAKAAAPVDRETYIAATRQSVATQPAAASVWQSSPPRDMPLPAPEPAQRKAPVPIPPGAFATSGGAVPTAAAAVPIGGIPLPEPLPLAPQFPS